MKNPLILCIIAGMTTGMGNGSVFGAALMLFLGRGNFSDWGGMGGSAFNPTSFVGIFDWIMIIFGVAFTVIMYVALGRHSQIEASKNS